MIVFVNREPTWIGGDIIKMRGFEAALSAMGFTIETTHEPKSSPAPDLYHVFNAPRPWAAFAMRAAREAGRPYVVTTIYFPKSIQTDQDPRTEAILRNAAALLVYTDLERDAILADYPRVEGQRFIHVLKGVQPHFSLPKAGSARDVPVMIVGQVGPRKHQRAALQACHTVRVLPLVIGEVRDIDYWTTCKRFPHRYLGAMRQPAIAALLRRTRVLMNTAVFDPGPDVILEAAMSGCQVVCTKETYLRADLPGVFWCDPQNPDSVAEALEKALASTSTELYEYVRDNYRWDIHAQRTADLYRELM